MKFILKISEIFPLAIFFILFYAKDIFYATAGIVLYAIFSCFMMILSKHHMKQVWLTNALIIVFGSLSLISKDPQFIKMKPTVVYIFFANLLFWSAILQKPLLKTMLSHILTLNERLWKRYSIIFSLYFIFCGVLNEIVWRNFDDVFWVNFKVFGLTSITILFFIVFMLCNKKHIKLGKYLEK